MALEQQDLDRISEHIRKILPRWLGELEIGPTAVSAEMALRDRTVRVEEALKHQRELMIQGFEQVEKRFEQVDKRFEQMEKRFEQVDKRFEALTKRIDRFMIGSFGLTITMTGLIIAFIKLG